MIKHMVLVGGSHGNEWTGAYLLKYLENDKAILASESFSTHYIFANK